MAGSSLFTDGAAYERMMGVWSRIVGQDFLRWIAAPSAARWADIGCGNGAFTHLIVETYAPASVIGVDPSEGQLTYARDRLKESVATFKQGDALSLQVADASCDVSVMALVLFFLRDPGKGARELARITRPGGLAAAYCWDIPGGGFPLEDSWDEIRQMGHQPMLPPSAEASRREAMEQTWRDAGFAHVRTEVFPATRTFTSFDQYWDVAQASSVGQQVATFTPAQVEELKRRLRSRLSIGSDGSVTVTARANAVKGTVPG